MPGSKVAILGMVIQPLMTGILIMGPYKPLLLGWFFPSPIIWKCHGSWSTRLDPYQVKQPWSSADTQAALTHSLQSFNASKVSWLHQCCLQQGARCSLSPPTRWRNTSATWWFLKKWSQNPTKTCKIPSDVNNFDSFRLLEIPTGKLT